MQAVKLAGLAGLAGLGRCAASGCGRWQADGSRNGSRRYCSPACAGRTTVAAYRARNASEGTRRRG